MLVLKIICPIIVLTLLGIWNFWRHKRSGSLKLRSSFKTLEEVCGSLESSKFLGLEKILPNLKNYTKNIRIFQILEGEKIIAVALYSWPSSLWRFRVDRNEEIELGSFSHIHYIGVLEEYQNKGYCYELMDKVISDTHRVSSGITIDLDDLKLKEIFKKKFEFSDCGTYMKLDYGNWSRL